MPHYISLPLPTTLQIQFFVYIWKSTDFYVLDPYSETEASEEDIHSCCSGYSCTGFGWDLSAYFLLLWTCRWTVTLILKLSKNGGVQACKEGVWGVPPAKSTLPISCEREMSNGDSLILYIGNIMVIIFSWSLLHCSCLFQQFLNS